MAILGEGGRRGGLGLAVASVLLLLVAPSWARGIRVYADPGTTQVRVGDQVCVPIIVDMPDSSELLGSLTATLQWRTGALKFERFEPGSAKGFGKPVVNTRVAGDGRLVFAAVNPLGGGGRLEVLRVYFRAVGQPGEEVKLAVKVKAMAAAYSFVDLLPEVEPVPAEKLPTIRISARR